MHFVPHNNSNNMRNEEETRALQESGAALSRARFDSMPNPEEFRGRLKNQLLEKRQLKRTSMWEKIKKAVRSLGIGQIHFVSGIAVFLIITILTAYLVTQKGVDQNNKIAELFISPVFAEDNFEVIPTEGDEFAIENTTHFIVKSKTPLDESVLRQNLRLSPNVSFTVEKINDNEFRVIPIKELENKVVYSLTIDSSYINENNVAVERDFSWAFQVKNDLRVVRTLPGNKGTGVPVNSGIEFTFNSDRYQNYEKAITFEPNVEGKFEHHGRTLVFVPTKGLLPETIYTVTVDKIITAAGTNPMKEGHQFQFETEAPTEERSYWNLSTTYLEFAPNQVPALPLWSQNQNDDFDINVFAFSSVNEFTTALQKNKQYPDWSYSARNKEKVDTSLLQKVQSFNVKPSQNRYNSYLVFPESMKAGFYLVEINSQGKSRQALLQISNLATFVSITDTDTLIWVNSVQTKQPVTGASVTHLGTNTKGMTTDKGVALLNTSKILPQGNQGGNYAVEYFLVQKGNDSIVVLVSRYGYDTYASNVNTEKNWQYISLDRTVYLPGDDVLFWGFVQPRNGELLNKTITVSFDAPYYSLYGIEDASEQVFYPKKEITLNEQGFFEGTMSVKGIRSGNYSLIFKNGEEILERKYIEIQKYVKPAYTLSLSGSKNAIYAGETINFETEAKFFEGTPLPGMTLISEGNVVTTDQDGKAKFTVKGQVEKCTPDQAYSCTRSSQSRYIDIRPSRSEEGEITAASGYTVYPAHAELRSELVRLGSSMARVSSTASMLDISVLNNENPDDDSSVYVTVAKNRPVILKIQETSYIKTEDGQYYDFINKKTQKIYRYERVEKDLPQVNLTTDENGHLNYDFSVNPEKSYTVQLFLNDGFGNNAYDQEMLYRSSRYEFDYSYIWYSLRDKLPPEQGYSIGDRVTLELYKNDDKVENIDGQVLYYQTQKGLKKFTVSTDPTYTFTFGQEHVPNVYMDVVYFDGISYQTSASNWYSSILKYNPKAKQLNVNVIADKSTYAPGEEMKLKLKVIDQSGAAHQSTVNLKLIDEAYYAIGGYNPNPLSDLYKNVASGVIANYDTHRFSQMRDGATGAEMGCFLSGTQIRLSNGQTKNIEDIVVGDEVLTFEDGYSLKKTPGKVVSTKKHLVHEYLLINDSLRVTAEHVVFLNGSWSPIGEARVGDILRSENGNLTIIQTIEKKYGVVEVYNFEVEKYHTYFADGIYVHNDKGGPGGTRQFFPDVALFKKLSTGANGEAELTIKLPDSITSWRLTAEAVSTDLFAGREIKKIPVTLPLFAQTVFPEEFVVGDAPIFTLRGYGSALIAGEVLKATVESPFAQNGKVEKNGQAFGSIGVPFASLSVGDHAVTTTLSAKDRQDSILRRFTVVNSRLTRLVHEKLDLSLGKIVPGTERGMSTVITTPAKIIFMSEGRGILYRHLRYLSCDCGERIDQKIGESIGKNLLSEYFGEKKFDEVQDLSNYQDVSGGIKLLPYDSPDVELSSKIAALSSDSFDRTLLTQYFYSQLLNPDYNDKKEAPLALYGLSALGEPVLPAIRSLAQQELEVKEKLFVALSAAELGDFEFAREIYREVAKSSMRVTLPTARIQIDENETHTLENTALAAVLASQIGEKYAPELMNYVKENKSTEILTNLEQLLYIKNTLPNLSGEAAQVTMTIGDRSEVITIEKNQVKRFDLLPQDITNVRFVDVKGPIAALLEYDASVAGQTKSPMVSIDKKYFVNGKEATQWNQTDLVAIRISPKLSKDAPKGDYLIEDVLPSGLTLITRPYVYEREYSSCHPQEVDGKIVKFFFSNNYSSTCLNSGWTYYARVSSPGEYKSEPTMIQSIRNLDIWNVGGYAGQITIKQ